MWPFRSKVQSRGASDQELVELLSKLTRRCDQLQLDVEALRESQDALRGQHLSLRGRVYALWGKEPPTTSSAVPDAAGDPPSPGRPETKAEAKARLLREGILVPGRPVKHN